MITSHSAIRGQWCHTRKFLLCSYSHLYPLGKCCREGDWFSAELSIEKLVLILIQLRFGGIAGWENNDILVCEKHSMAFRDNGVQGKMKPTNMSQKK